MKHSTTDRTIKKKSVMTLKEKKVATILSDIAKSTAILSKRRMSNSNPVKE